MILQKYGWHGIYAFECMLFDDNHNIVYQDYTATMLEMLATAVAGISGKDMKIPSFFEMVYPQQNKRQEMTAQQVIDHVLSMLQ